MREERIDLKPAFRETPDMCRDAVLRAVSSYREEEKMKRPLIMMAVAALILALLTGTALALVHYYSVRDSVAGGNPSKAFEERVVPLENSKSMDSVTVTLGDSVFDGKALAYTVMLEAEEGTSPVLIVPELKALCQGSELSIDFGGDVPSDYIDGFLYPSADAQHKAEDAFTVSARFGEQQPWDTVDWVYTLYVLKPNWEIVQPSGQYAGLEEYEEEFRKAYAEHKIMAEYGMSLSEYADVVAESVITDDHIWQYSFLMDTLLAAGAFEQAGEITFEFSTPLPEIQRIKGENLFRFDGYSVAVQEITTSFMRVHYDLQITLEEPFAREHDLAFFYDLYDQAGNLLEWKGSVLSGGEDHTVVRVRGTAARISDDPLTGITFRPSKTFCTDQSIWKDEFTVSIE